MIDRELVLLSTSQEIKFISVRIENHEYSTTLLDLGEEKTETICLNGFQIPKTIDSAAWHPEILQGLKSFRPSLDWP